MAIFAFPSDVQAVTQIASSRAPRRSTPGAVEHMRQVEAGLCHGRRGTAGRPLGESQSVRWPSLRDRAVMSPRVFGAMEFWMLGGDRSLAELARLCHAALSAIEAGPVDGMFRHH